MPDGSDMRALIIWLVVLSCPAIGQVQHNFKMEPEKTDCHEIILTSSNDEDIALVQSATYRFTQTLKISRYRLPKSLTYYSCDGTSGLVIAEEEQPTLITEIRKTTWDSLMQATDPIEFYLERIKSQP